MGHVLEERDPAPKPWVAFVEGTIMQVQDIMTRDPICCTPATNLVEAARLMRDYDCGALPVVENESSRRVVGIITDRDIACRSVAEGKDSATTLVNDCMSSATAVVSPDDAIEECCDLMEQKQVRRMLVVDEGGGCCGIVSQADIALRGFLGKTAEVVREVSRPSEGGIVNS
jgi:CBS domain-containing protein